MRVEHHPALHSYLLSRYSYLSEGSYIVHVPCGDKAELIGILEEEGRRSFVVVYEAEEFRTQDPNHFPFLSRDENHSLTSYRSFRLLEPWPQPLLSVTFDALGEGEVVGTAGRTEVRMREMGSAQVWYGPGVALIWEILLDDPGPGDPPEARLLALWRMIEDWLASALGVHTFVTAPHDPAYEEEWYLEVQVLEQMGYRREGKAMRRVRRT